MTATASKPLTAEIRQARTLEIAREWVEDSRKTVQDFREKAANLPNLTELLQWDATCLILAEACLDLFGGKTLDFLAGGVSWPEKVEELQRQLRGLELGLIEDDDFSPNSTGAIFNVVRTQRVRAKQQTAKLLRRLLKVMRQPTADEAAKAERKALQASKVNSDAANALVHQKNQLLNLISGGSVFEALMALELVAELWNASSYAYKTLEVCERVLVALNDVNRKPGVSREAHERLLEATRERVAELEKAARNARKDNGTL